MVLTKWNELKEKNPGYRDQEEIYSYEIMKGSKNMERKITQKELGAELKQDGIVEVDALESVTKYDFDKCEVLQRKSGLSSDSVCKGQVTISPIICNSCPHFIGNKEDVLKCAETKTDSSLEDKIFDNLYSNYSLGEGIELLRSVIDRLEYAQKQNASEALNVFMNNYCGSNRCSNCMFICVDDSKCLAKMQIAQIKKEI